MAQPGLARLLGVQEVESSNLSTPTILTTYHSFICRIFDFSRENFIFLGIIRKQEMDMLTEDKRNPDWKRPADWPYDEDFGSKVWNGKMKALDAKLRERNKRIGFTHCPKCGSDHTNFTVVCRNCSYKVKSEEVKA